MTQRSIPTTCALAVLCAPHHPPPNRTDPRHRRLPHRHPAHQPLRRLPDPPRAVHHASHVDVSSPPTSDDTTRLQAALTACESTGKSVVLAASGSNNAFFTRLSSPSNGEALVINSGVTLEGNNSYSSQSELLNITGNNSFIYGPGAIDGRATSSPARPASSRPTPPTTSSSTTLPSSRPRIPTSTSREAAAPPFGASLSSPRPPEPMPTVSTSTASPTSPSTSSTIEAGDDGVAVKTNESAASNITVENHRLYGTHGLSIGSQTFDGVTNVLFNNNYVYGNDLAGIASTDANAINIKTDLECGGLVNKVLYKNICITNAKHLIVFNTAYGSCQSGTAGAPQSTRHRRQRS